MGVSTICLDLYLSASPGKVSWDNLSVRPWQKVMEIGGRMCFVCVVAASLIVDRRRYHDERDTIKYVMPRGEQVQVTWIHFTC